MKNLLILITVLLVGGCGKGKEAQTKTKVTEDNNATKGPFLGKVCLVSPLALIFLDVSFWDFASTRKCNR